MGRRTSTVEYLERLIKWAGGRKPFCQKTGIYAADVYSYLNGRKHVTWKRLHSATAQVFGEPPAILPKLEGWNLFEDGPPKFANISGEPGLYALFDSAMRVIYFGKTKNLYLEVRQTLRRHVAEVRPWTGKHNLRYADIASYLSAYTVARSDRALRHDLEVLVLRLLVNNTFNKNAGYFVRDA
jgi:hypothetical protein